MQVDAGPEPTPVADWRAEATRLFGPDPYEWAFTCPFCKARTPVGVWVEHGVGDPGRAAHECIGRLVGAKGGLNVFQPSPGPQQPCDWAAWGLFGTLNGGRKVLTSPGIGSTWTFDFAPTHGSARDVLRYFDFIEEVLP